jgi:hypothetical protein
MTAPIALFVYNRPEHTRKTIDALAKNTLALQSDLFVYADGGKNNEDWGLVRTVRHIVSSASGFRSVQVVEHAENKGLASSIIGGVTEIVRERGSVIVLEDDILTSPFFLAYMNDALAAYAHDDRVAGISGFLPPIQPPLPDYFFFSQPTSWGWATWKRAWDHFNNDASFLLAELTKQNRVYEFDIGGSYGFSRHLLLNARKKMNTWAVKWYASSFLRGGLFLYPGASFVRNIGNDGSGVHGTNNRLFDVGGLAPAYVPLRKIPVEENADAFNAFRKFYLKYKRNIVLRGITKAFGFFKKSVWK